MLLLTGGRPPAFVVNLTACSSIVFVTYSEARRLAKFLSNRTGELPFLKILSNSTDVTI